MHRKILVPSDWTSASSSRLSRLIITKIVFSLFDFAWVSFTVIVMYTSVSRPGWYARNDLMGYDEKNIIDGEKKVEFDLFEMVC